MDGRETRIKTDWKSLTESPMVNFINIFRGCFSYKSAFLPKSFRQSQKVTREKLRKALLYEKFASTMLMKLTPTYNFDSIQKRLHSTSSVGQLLVLLCLIFLWVCKHKFIDQWLNLETLLEIMLLRSIINMFEVSVYTLFTLCGGNK